MLDKLFLLVWHVCISCVITILCCLVWWHLTLITFCTSLVALLFFWRSIPLAFHGTNIFLMCIGIHCKSCHSSKKILSHWCIRFDNSQNVSVYIAIVARYNTIIHHNIIQCCHSGNYLPQQYLTISHNGHECSSVSFLI